MNFAPFQTLSYTTHTSGNCGAFAWYAPDHARTRWMVICEEPSFSPDEYFSYAVVDNYGNLIRVPA